MKKIWEIVDEKTAVCYLDDNHHLFVSRTKKGITLRMKDMRGKPHCPEKPIVLYVNRITESQLGYKLRVEEYNKGGEEQEE